MLLRAHCYCSDSQRFGVFYFLVLILTLLFLLWITSWAFVTFSMPFMVSQTAPYRSLSINGISSSISQPVPRPKPVPRSWSACQASLMCWIWSVYSIPAVGVIWIYTASQFTTCAALFLFLIISTNLFSFWSQQATELAFSPTGQPFSLFDWFPVLIACLSAPLTVLCTDPHTSLLSHRFLTALWNFI